MESEEGEEQDVFIFSHLAVVERCGGRPKDDGRSARNGCEWCRLIEETKIYLESKRKNKKFSNIWFSFTFGGFSGVS